jgi:uncharacterized protein (DUF488 family)
VATGVIDLWTIGHGAADLNVFLSHLRGGGIERIIDVRRFPASRRHPQFASASLQRALSEAGVAYAHCVDLGGRRRPLPDSENVGLRNAAFRGYADYMASASFGAAFDDAMSSPQAYRTCIMCAETPWWKCHRRLIADAAVLLRGVTVTHLVSGRPSPHRLTDGVRLIDGRLRYI